MNPSVRKDAIDDTYRGVVKILQSICNRIQKKFGGDFDDYFSEAEELFMLHYETFDDAKSCFTHWIYYKVHMGLMDKRRVEIIRNKNRRIETNSEATERAAFYEHGGDWLDDLSEEAQAVIQLTLRMSRPNRREIRYKLLSLGWSVEQVQECFEEIARALS